MITTEDLDLEAWVRSQIHRDDDVGDLGRQLAQGAVRVTNLPRALRPALIAARAEFGAGGEVLAGAELSAQVAELRDAARLHRQPAASGRRNMRHA